MGGTGVFGSRLITGLLETTEFDVILAGRSPERLDAECARLALAWFPGSRQRVRPLVLDTATVSDATLRGCGALAVVDAAGPFRAGDYRLAQAAIAAGIHYVDLADGRAFVAGFRALDGAAKAAGVVALTGASSTPALSNAALDKMTAGWKRVDRVEIAISPGNRTPRGLSVIRSILSYSGKPVRVFADGRWCERPGWGMTVRRDIPGVGRRWLSLSETPDLDVVPERFRVTDAAIFRAGLELPILHLGLSAASLLVRGGLLRSLEPFARLVRTLAPAFERLGTDRGGMTVDATGSDGDGQPIKASWNLVAEAGDGPYVPTLPALAAVRALADGRLNEPGANICAGVLSLGDIEAEFAPRRIHSEIRSERQVPSLDQRVLADRFNEMPELVRRMHMPGWGLRASGTASVEGAVGVLARVLAAIFRFPPPASEVPVTVIITPVSGSERWVRDFGGRRFTSILSPASSPGRIVERFGSMAFELDLPVGPTGVLGMPVSSWRLGPIPMPRFLAPVSLVSESVDGSGRFFFDVELRLPLGLGRLVRYRGFLNAGG